MPSITLGRKRPSEAIILDGARQNKKLKFTEDGEAVVVKATPVSASSATHSSKVKPDYSKLTKRGDKNAPQSRGGTKDANTGSSILNAEDIDFPRGGGSTLTPLEHKEMRAEGMKEAEMEIFKEKNEAAATQSSRKRLRNGKSKLDTFPSSKKGKSGDKDAVRIEYLTYKKLVPGTRVLAQVVAITSLSVVVSLPHQMLGHIPIDKISKGLNDAMDKLIEQDDNSDSDSEASSNDKKDTDGDEEEEGEAKKEEMPTLQEIFHPGQYVRAIVMAVHPHGVVAQPSTSGMSLGKPRNELEKASRRVELSLLPQDINSGMTVKDLGKGFVLPASVASIEDHGYILDFGIPNVSGFLSFKDAKKELLGRKTSRKLRVGMLLDTYVKKTEENGRMCAVGVGEKTASSELSNLTSISAVHPGALVRGLITASSSSGINVQVLGLFNGTIHPLHISLDASKLQIGKKLQARILWDVLEMEPRQFALSTLEHVVKLEPRSLQGSTAYQVESGGENEEPEDGHLSDVERIYPVGTILDDVKISRVDSDRGLYLDITESLKGVVHISDVSDEHVPALSATSGPYKVDSIHRVRVTGYHPLDGILQCSMKESILEQKWLRVDDVTVGEMVKGTIMNLTDRGLFISISGNVHAVIWPNHYADIRLKHPERKFKVGKSIKCRVLVVDPEKNRICLTAKKTLIESTLPIISNVVDVEVGTVAHATIFKVSERYLSVEFYNGVRGIIPMKEATDVSAHTLEGLFGIGQVVKVRITEVKPDGTLLVASILKAASEFISPATEINKIQIGSTVSGTVTDIHKDNVVLKLIPTQTTALLSLNNLANFRTTSVSQLRASLKIGAGLEDLVVASKNSSKSLVIVAAQPKKRTKLPAQDSSLRMENLKVGQSYLGMVVKQSKKGATVRLAKHVFGTLHPTDVSDDYLTSNSFPAVESVINVMVIDLDVPSHQVVLSTRPSRVNGKAGAKTAFPDPEISDIQSLKVGQTVRGFVKSVADSGLFVALSRALDARVQIKELFDEYVKDWKPQFKDNQLVQGRILNINTDTNQIEMTLRSGDLTRAAPTKSLSAFTKGDRVDGVVKKVEEYGIFVEIKGTKVSGLCHKSELADNSGPSPSEILKSFKEGDPVRALVLSVDTEKKRISFGLKPSYFFDEDLRDESQETTDEAEELDDEMVHGANQQDDEMPDPDDDSVDEEILVVPGKQNTISGTSGAEEFGAIPLLSLTAPLRWDTNSQANVIADTASETSDDEADEPARKKRKRRHEIQHDLTVNIQQRAPQSSIDFERLLLSSPNSSYLWLQFMAFQLQLSEIEKAREIGRRALKAINFREEQERLNVWIALLNLETSYGTEASLDAVFKEAARANDSKTIHWRLAILLDESQKHDRAEDQFRKTCKKFGSSSKVWTLFAEHYFKRSMPDEARQLLPRSLLSLDKRKHLKTISKFAQLEFRMGDPERGRTVFEGIIDTHSKRLDLWNIYIDMEAGQNDIQRVRGICERAITLKLSKKKAKFLFKKWLDLERRLGDEHGAEFVKQKAVEWTQNATQE